MKQRKNALFHFTLDKRLALYFIIFGLVIGHVVFYFAYLISKRSSVQETASFFTKNIFSDLALKTDGDILLDLNDPRYRGISDKIRIMLEKSDNSHFSLQNTYLFYHVQADSSWNQLVMLNSDEFRTVGIFDKARNNQLEKLCRISHGNDYFSRINLSDFSNATFLAINLTRPQDTNSYYFVLSLQKDTYWTIFRKNLKTLALMDISMLLLSTILAWFFSRPISRPIRKIADGANIIAKGDYNHRLNMKRGDEIGLLSESLDSMAEKINSNINEIQRNLDTMNTMNRIDKAVLSSISRHDLMTRVISIASDLFQSVCICILLRNETDSGYDILNYDSDNAKLNKYKTIFDHTLNQEVQWFLSNQSFYTRDDKNQNIRTFLEEMHQEVIGCAITIPLVMAEKYYGSLVFSRESMTAFQNFETDQATMIADQVCVALQSVRIFEEKEALLFGIMVALTKSIDAKSRWTAGHSERVSMYSEELARLLDWDEKMLRQLTISAVLHDIGKISVPEMILDKPSRLTTDEYEIIKGHPVVGARIIEDIPSYGTIVPGILHHHEHWDGSGYPKGLKGNDIPLMSRIIALADVYDAVSSERPYRKGMNHSEVLLFMKEQKGKLFDPELTDLFITLIIKNHS